MSDAAEAKLTAGLEPRPEHAPTRAAARGVARAAWLLVLMLAMLAAAGRAPDDPAVGGRPMLGAVHESLIAVVPDRVAVATRVAPAPAMRQWLGADEQGAATGPDRVAVAPLALPATIGPGKAARILAARPGRARNHAASPFQARAPPTAA